MIKLPKLFVLVLLVLANLLANGNDYFVSVNGNDSNSGTIEMPFKTIQKAANAMQAGDVCYIREGVYRETVTPPNSGSAGNPVSFINYNNEKVIITGLDPVADWTKSDGDSWKANISQTVTQLFINNRRANLARYPNAGLSMFDTENWTEAFFNQNQTGVIQGISVFGNLSGAKVIGLGARNWVSICGIVTNSFGDEFSVTNESFQWKSNYDPQIYLEKGKAFVCDHKALLDAQYEWFYASQNIFVIPPEKRNPNDLTIEARVRMVGMNLSNKSYINVKGIHFKAGNLVMQNANNCKVEKCSVLYPRPFFMFANGFNRDNEPAKWDGTGIEISGANNIIKDCYVAHSWGDGVSIWGENNTIENCIVEDCDWMAVDSAPVCVTGKGHVIKGNTLRETGRSVLVHRNLKSGKIVHNNLHSCGFINDDLGLTYTFMTDSEGTEIAYNWVHDNYALRTATGIYLDNYCSNTVVHHNVVWNCGEGIRLNLPQTNTDVFNNTFWNNRNPMGSWGREGKEMTNCRVWNNIQNHNKFIGTDIQNNLFSSDSLFVNAMKGDYRLISNSGAVDYGKVIEGITNGYKGAAPDAGAYELGDNWTPGSDIEISSFGESLPVRPENFQAEISPGQIRFQWEDMSNNETGFAVDRKGTSGGFKQIGTVNANAVGYVDNTVEPEVKYTYRLRAFNDYGNSVCLDFITLTSANDGSFLKLQAEKYDEASGIIKNQDYIGGCDNNDFVMFKQVDFGTGFDSLTIRYAADPVYAGKNLIIKIDGLNGKAIANLVISSTGGFTVFAESKFNIEKTTGIHDVYFIFSGGYGVGNFDWFYFESKKKTTSSSKVKVNKPNWNLGQNYPNPFRQQTQIPFFISQKSKVIIRLFNLQGAHIRTIVDDEFEQGVQVCYFDSMGLKPGIYLYVMNSSCNGSDLSSGKETRLLQIIK